MHTPLHMHTHSLDTHTHSSYTYAYTQPPLHIHPMHTHPYAYTPICIHTHMHTHLYAYTSLYMHTHPMTLSWPFHTYRVINSFKLCHASCSMLAITVTQWLRFPYFCTLVLIRRMCVWCVYRCRLNFNCLDYTYQASVFILYCGTIEVQCQYRFIIMPHLAREIHNTRLQQWHRQKHGKQRVVKTRQTKSGENSRTQ